MAPSRGGRKRVVSSDDEFGDDHFTIEDIVSGDETTTTNAGALKPQSPAKTKLSLKSPSKPKSTRPTVKASLQKATSKGKAAAAGQENGRAKGTLFSFFNAATQRQQAPADSPAPPQSPPAKQITEEVEGIDDGEGQVTVLNGSRTALAARKRKQNDVAHLFDPAVFSAASASAKFRKSSGGAKIATKETDRRPWTEQFGPADLAELAVHNRKVGDVRRLLEDSLSPRGRPRLILLKGPAGTGKTTTLRLLAKDIGLEVREWKNPNDVDIASKSFTSTSAQFEDFLYRGGSFTGLDLSTNSDDKAPTREQAQTLDASTPSARNVILIEEFPVVLTRSSPILLSFRNTLLAYLSTSHIASRPAAPIVIVMSETLLSASNSSESMAPHRLLGPAILTHPLTATIEFNPIAPTLLTKALSLVTIKEARVSGRRRTPGLPVLSKLAEMGDVRSAVAALEFLCLRGDEGESWSSKINFTKPKARAGAKNAAKSAEADMTEQEREALKIVGGRETALDLWHGVGKVVYNKRIEVSTGSVSVKEPENDPEQMFVELATDPATFIAAVHENFVQSCASANNEGSMVAMDECLSALSDADSLTIENFVPGAGYGAALEGIRQEEIAFHAAIRGVVFSLPYPVKRESTSASGRSRANVMAWPQSLRLWRSQEELDDLADLCLEEYRKVLNDGNKLTAPDNDKETQHGWWRPSASSKLLMILEQAPYMQLIQKSTGDISALREHIGKITHFTTQNSIAPDMGRPAADMDASDDEDMTTGPIRTRRTRTKGKGADAHEGIFAVEEDIKALVLSEDDIEDD